MSASATQRLHDTFPSPSQAFTTVSGLPVCRYALGGAARSKQPGTLASLYYDLLKSEDASSPLLSFPKGAPFYFYYNPHRYPDLLSGIQKLCEDKSRRENLFVASGGHERSAAEMEQRLQDSLQWCGGAYLDLFILEYIAPEELEGNAIREAMEQAQAWKRQGLVRHVGASTHSHRVGAILAKGYSGIETVMLRYGMSHKDAAEKWSFPACVEHQKPVLAFTTTRWNRLQEGHEAWNGEPPSTGDCLSFALRPPVECILHSARDEDELKQALKGFRQDMSNQEIQNWRSFGDLEWNSGDQFDEFPDERLG